MFGLEFPGLSSQRFLPVPHPVHTHVIPPQHSDSLGVSKWLGLGWREVDSGSHWWWSVNSWGWI